MRGGMSLSPQRLPHPLFSRNAAPPRGIASWEHGAVTWPTLADLVRITWQVLPWAIPLVLAGTAVAILVGVVGQRRRGATAWLVAALIVSVSLVAAFTLTPNSGLGEAVLGDPRADLGPWGYLREPGYWLHLDERTLNVALFIPLGLTLALLARGAVRWVLLAAGLAAPWVIEGLQWVLPFDRGPQVNDLVDNSTGFLVGFAVGLVMTSSVREVANASP